MSELLAIENDSETEDALRLFPITEAPLPGLSSYRSSFRRQHLRVMRRRRQDRSRRSAAAEWTIRSVVLMCGLFIGVALHRPAATRATSSATVPSQAVTRSTASEGPIVANVLPVIDGGERGTVGDVTPAIDPDVAPPAAAPDLRRAAGHRGTLIVTSTPDGASVFMNQKYSGRTPLVLHDVAAGSRAVRVDLDGYGSWSRGISVVANESTTVSATLIPTTAP